MPNKRNLQPLLDARQNHLALLFGDSDATDAIALGIMGFSAAALIFGLESALKSPWWLWLLLLVFFISSIISAIAAVWPRRMSGASVDLKEHPEYLLLDEQQLVLQLLADTQASIEQNRPIIDRKSFYCTMAIMLAIIGTEVLLACIIKL